MYTLNFIPAGKGDCFLLCLDGEIKKNIVIDAGFNPTYEGFLKPLLNDLAEKKELINRFIITHIDVDHITGAIPFLEENGMADSPDIIGIEQVWHNSLRHLYEPGEINKEEDSPENKVVIEKISRKRHNSPRTKFREDAGALQGSALASLLVNKGYSWNKDFEGKAVVANSSTKIILDDETSIILLSPSNLALQNLRGKWEDELEKNKYKIVRNNCGAYDEAFEYVTSYEDDDIDIGVSLDVNSDYFDVDELVSHRFSEDNAINNSSSIAFVIEHKGRKLLFLADAHPSQILRSLQQHYGNGKINFDLIKVSHHGSSNNLSPALLEKVDSNYFLFPTSGTRHHPSLETIARIISRDTEGLRNLVFNYSYDLLEVLKNEELQQKYKFNLYAPAEETITCLECSNEGINVTYKKP